MVILTIMALLTLYSLDALCLFPAMLLLIELGHRLQRRSAALGSDLSNSLAFESAVFALLGLLLAFTFSGAMSRYDAHRALITQEANAIGTAYLRIDLLPAETQPPIRQRFREYADIRAHRFEGEPGTAKTDESYRQSTRLQAEIWTAAVAAAALPSANDDATKLLLPALNDMIDITATRRNAFDMHPPIIVYVLLFTLACCCALIGGFGMTGTRRSWLHMIAFAAVITLTIYATLDIEYPQSGLVTLTSHDHVFLDLINSMH